MIKGVHLQIGRVLCVPFRHTENNVYMILTDYNYLVYTITPESLEKGEFILYLSFYDKPTNKVLFFKRLKDVPILEAYNSYTYYTYRKETQDIDFGFIRYKEYRERNDCTFYIKDEVIEQNNNLYQITNSSLSKREKVLIVYLAELNKEESFCDSLKIKDIKAKEKEITEIVNKLNISEIINSYVIKQDSFHLTKIGGDDKYEEWLSSECNYYDEYISDLLPQIHTTYWEDSGYTTHLYPPKEVTLKYKKIAEDKTIEIRRNAEANYDKEKHVEVLMDKYIDDIISKAIKNVKDNYYLVSLRSMVYSYWGYIKGMPYVDDREIPELPYGCGHFSEEQADQYCNSHKRYYL